MMLKVTLDTNVIISAILFGGKPEEIIKLASSEQLIIFISHDILAETVFILRSKFGWSNLQIEHAERMLRDIATIITPQERLKVIKKDEADNRILECALEGAADFIISGDKKHILPLRRCKQIPIVTAAAFLDHFHK